MTLRARQDVIEHYNRNVAAMENRPYYYDWVLAVLAQAGVPREAAICDVGCGTGALLAQLQARGYAQLAGSDFAPGCVAVAQARLLGVDLYAHDIERAPLPRQYDVITMTGVIDFVADPESALRHLRASLRPGGRAIVSMRNRLAYWPLYHLRGLAARLPDPWLRHWALWFSTPLGMRRTDQPHERVYAPAELRRLLRHTGLRPLQEHSFQWLPMLWIPDLVGLLRIMQLIDGWSHRLPGRSRYYTYLFVCEADESETRAPIYPA